MSKSKNPALNSQPVPSDIHNVPSVTDGFQSIDTNAPPAPVIHVVAMTMAVFVPLIGFVVAVITAWIHGWIGWLHFSLMISLMLLTGTGITVGYHRLLAHRSFETYEWVRAFWMVMGALAVQKSPVEWCSVHRWHHQMSDRPGDPHSPHMESDGSWGDLKGFWHSHAGWLFSGYFYADNDRYVPDLLLDKTAMWIHRNYHVYWIPFSFALPALIAGAVTQSWYDAWLGFLWGGLVRVFVVHHITWSINSVCHIFGTQDYKVSDHSKNNFLFGVLGLGEGWHNNHHAFPRSARQGLEWWQFDLSWIIIRSMELTGLAWNVQLPSKRAMENKRLS